ncbi:FISUMP domain-containing protein [Seonamhaeicola marinus]|uniref:Fibrobacter succinogenes major paralogous domain-containing protein n=1 Tax=Seonamhaeicola marinus TaxID=1912246 RepID=A0A5D0I4H9_9FLAO|nr:FISUMP domain-containing protein [Seonamhaeicola marinus]TYA78574.1 hypothetical protein FUA24_09475 [Seonamhaeicola marinus]
MKNFSIAFWVVLISCNLYAQKGDLKFAEKALKDGKEFNAAYFSAKALNHPKASKRIVKRAHKILSEYVSKGFDYRENEISSYTKKLQNYDKDESVKNASIVVQFTQDLIDYKTVLDEIPNDRLAPPKSKSPPVVVPEKDYSKALKSAINQLNEIKKKASLDYLKEARELSKEKMLDKLKESFYKYEKAIKLDNSVVESVRNEKNALGIRIGKLMLSEANSLYFSQGSSFNDKELAIEILEKASKYSEEEEIKKQKTKLGNDLCEVYYLKVRNLLELPLKRQEEGTNKNEKANTTVSGMKVSFDKNKAIQDIKNRQLKTSNSSPKRSTILAGNSNAVISSTNLDNSHQAIAFLDRIKKINPSYKDTKYLMQIALKGTWLIDYRDNKKYATAKIGNHIWMTTNLDFNASGSEYKTYCKDGKVVEVKKYGRFYNWYSVMKNSRSEGSQGVCPKGWRVPSVEDYRTLQNTIL